MSYENQKEVELFLFIDIETPATRKWVSDYLIKQGIVSYGQIPLSFDIRQYVLNQVISRYQNTSDLEKFALRMRNAWRVRRHRKSRNTKTLAVLLEAGVISKLSEMSKGSTKAEIITRLIEGNYQTFLAMKHEQEQKIAEAKEIDRKRKELNLLKRMMSRPMAESSLINKQLRVANDLKNIISMLDDITAELTNKEA
jgi:hypothetical protein